MDCTSKAVEALHPFLLLSMLGLIFAECSIRFKFWSWKLNPGGACACKSVGLVKQAQAITKVLRDLGLGPHS